MTDNTTDLLVRATHELAVLLDMYVSKEDLASETWEDAIDVLRDMSEKLLERGIPTPGVAENVLLKASGPRS